MRRLLKLILPSDGRRSLCGPIITGVIAVATCATSTAQDAPPQPAPLNRAARQYLELLENFAGFAEQHWNEAEQCYDAAGKGVTWPRGNGGVVLVNAVLLTEYPDKATFSPTAIPREVLLDHTRRAIRSVCLASNVCTDARAKQPGTWGGKDPSRGGWHWQAGLETEHWVVAAKLLEASFDDDTKALVHQVATAEADAAMREIPSARKGDTAADDCCWNAGVLGVCAAIYADDPRAAAWDEWAKRWALNTEARQCDRDSLRMIDGKPLGQWLTSVNAFDDLTLENHGFWDLPYQVCFAALAEPIVAYRLCGRKVPEAFYAHAHEEGEQILKWLVMPDGDLLCPQGIDWAERDVQHSWAFTEIGTLLDQPWARAAEARCLNLLTRRQAIYGDGSIHALDFGYETDLAVVWTFSFLLHKYFGKGDSGPAFDEPRGSKIFPQVAVAVHRTPELVSSVTWFHSRQAIMVSPNHLETLVERPSFTSYDSHNGTGWILLKGDKRPRAFQVDGQPRIERQEPNGEVISVSFSRSIKGKVRQQIDYCAFPGAVVVFCRWQALGNIDVAELVDHPFRFVAIDKFVTQPSVEREPSGQWVVDDKLRLVVIGGPPGEVAKDGVNGTARRDFTSAKGDELQQSMCVYQALLPGQLPASVTGDADAVQVGDWIVRRMADGVTVSNMPAK